MDLMEKDEPGKVTELSADSAVDEFSRMINRQRLHPRLWDYTYLLLRANAAVFWQFRELMGSRPMRVLDVGCGFKPWGVSLPKGTAYYGVDYSRRWSSADALASGDALPFADDSFDAVICSEVLEHARYPEKVIEEIRRVCRPNGLLYLTSPFAFHEHGIPYDYQRLTQYFYREVFRGDRIHVLEGSNSTFSTGLTACNMMIECSPLRLAWGFKHVLYTATNLAGLTIDALLHLVMPKVARSYRLYFFNLPLGYAAVIQVIKKTTGSDEA